MGLLGLNSLLSPRLFAALVIRVVQQASLWITEMFVIDEDLLDRLILRIFLISKHLSVANKKWLRHVDAIEPKLPLTGRPGRMPETSIRRSWIRIKRMAEFLDGQLDFSSCVC